MNDPSENRPRRRLLFWIAGALVSLGILSLLVWQAELSRLCVHLAHADGSLLLGAAGLFVCTCGFRWLRVVLIVPPTERRSFALLGASAGHAFLNKIMPLRTGELVFPYLLRRATGSRFAVGLAYLAVLRVVEMACLVVILSVSAVVYATEERLDLVGLWLAPSGFAAGLFALLALPRLLRWALAFLARRAGRSTSARAASLSQHLQDSADEIARLRPMDFGLLAGATIGVWASLYGVFFLTLRAFGLQVTWAQTVIGSTGGVLSNLLPINGIGSLGTLEAGWTAGFAATGESIAPVLAAGLTMHVSVIAVSGAVAAVGAIGLRRSSLADRVS